MAADPHEFPAAAGDTSALSHADDAFGFAVPPPPRPHDADPLPPGSDLGGVTIVRLIAEGGMGRVYEGRQSEPGRTVAVKVLRSGFASADLIRRFRYEARLLARLQHPSIARLYTFGTSGAGDVPFFVMELVEGARPITRYASESRLGIREAVTLLRSVCNAVAHGHQKGVIHRDLKPGNILVDTSGQPKVIDFGVARSLTSGGDGETQLTQVGDRVGTLRYMSPEQINAGDVDARSDVYALGLVMHEMLVGRLPYDLSSVPFVDAVRLLGDPEPIATHEIARVARGRGITGGDARSLATIAATCLAKDPAKRYATAVELDAELGRWLDGDAILARPPTAAESVARFVRRHRAASIAAAAVLASLVTAVWATSMFYVNAERQRLLAEDARRLAERRERDAEEQAAAARAQLYVSNVLLAAAARDRDNVAEARRLIAGARELSGDAHTTTPLELDCIAASLDESLAAAPVAPGAVTAIGWSHDGRMVAVGAEDGGVRLGATDGDRIVWEPTPLGQHEGRVWSACFAPDDGVVASAAADGTVRLWSVSERGPIATLPAVERATYATAFSRDGRFLATGGRDRVVRIWNTTTWELHGELAGHQATVLSTCFLGDSPTVASAAADGTIHVWEGLTGTSARTLRGHDDRVFAVGSSPDGRLLASAGEDGSARIWDLRSGGERLLLKHPFRVNGVAWLDEGGRVATACADGVVRVWSAADGSELRHLRGHTESVWSIAAATVSGRLASGGGDGTVRLWDGDEHAEPVMQCGARVLSVACSPDGRHVATALSNATARLWNAATLEAGPVLRKGVGRVNDVAFSPDGRTLAGACDDGTVQLWDRDSGERRRWIKPHDRRIYSVDFAADGRWLATGADDGSARIIDLRTEAVVGDPLKHGRRVFRATFSPEGHLLATAGEDRTARLWNVSEGREVRRLGPHDGPVNWVAFSPAGDLLVTACTDGMARLWEVATGNQVATLTGPVRQMWRVAFSPDGRRVAAVAADGAAQLWDVATGRALAMLRGHTDQAWGVAFTADGRGLVTGSWDGTARLWGVSVAEIARRRAGN